MAEEIYEKLKLFAESFVNNFCINVITHYDFLKEKPMSSDTGCDATTVNGKRVWLPQAARNEVIAKLENLMSNLTRSERTNPETWLKNASSNKILREVAFDIFQSFEHKMNESSEECIIEYGNTLAVKLFKSFVSPNEDSPHFDVITMTKLIVTPHPTDDCSILYCMNFNLYSLLWNSTSSKRKHTVLQEFTMAGVLVNGKILGNKSTDMRYGYRRMLKGEESFNTTFLENATTISEINDTYQYMFDKNSTVPDQVISGTKLTTSDIKISLSAMKGDIKKNAKELRENLKCDVLTKVVEEMNYINDVPTATKEVEKKEEKKENISQQGNVQQNSNIENLTMSFNN